jgi:hypothetical protein
MDTLRTAQAQPLQRRLVGLSQLGRYLARQLVAAEQRHHLGRHAPSDRNIRGLETRGGTSLVIASN